MRKYKGIIMAFILAALAIAAGLWPDVVLPEPEFFENILTALEDLFPASEGAPE